MWLQRCINAFEVTITVVQQGAHSAVIAADRNNKQVIFKKLWKKTL